MKQLINEEFPEENDEGYSLDESNNINVPWYLLDTDKNICKFWDLLITFFIT